MIALRLVLALIIGISQQSNPAFADSQTTMQDAQTVQERHKQAAIRINELAGQIRSEADARALVDEIADFFERTAPGLDKQEYSGASCSF